MGVRLDWDEKQKVLRVGRGWLARPLCIGPDGIDASGERLERHQLRRIVIERRGIAQTSRIVVIAEVRGASAVEERVLAELPASALPLDRLERLHAVLAELDLRPLVRTEQGPARGDSETTLSEEEANSIEGARLPEGCGFLPAGLPQRGWDLWAGFGLAGAGMLFLELLAGTGMMDLRGSFGVVGATVALALATRRGRRSLRTFLARASQGWEIGRAEGIYLLPDELLVWVGARPIRFPRRQVLGIAVKQRPAGRPTLLLEYEQDGGRFELDLCALAPGRFASPTWPRLIIGSEAWCSRTVAKHRPGDRSSR